LITVTKASGATEESILEAVLEAGAEEVKDNGESFEIITNTKWYSSQHPPTYLSCIWVHWKLWALI
jgi:transcriptional/translational regulatory protein YebC/TACO1